jgi:hypothetical protein
MRMYYFYAIKKCVPLEDELIDKVREGGLMPIVTAALQGAIAFARTYASSDSCHDHGGHWFDGASGRSFCWRRAWLDMGIKVLPGVAGMSPKLELSSCESRSKEGKTKMVDLARAFGSQCNLVDHEDDHPPIRLTCS